MCMMMMGLLGGAVSAIGSIAQGQAQADAYRRQAQEDRTNAQLQQRQASAEEIAGQFKQRQMGDQAGQRAAAQIAAYAAGGMSLSGSPTDVVIDSRRNAQLDIGAERYNTDLKSDNLMFKARNYASMADDADKAADNAETASIFGAITPLIGGMSKLGGAF